MRLIKMTLRAILAAAAVAAVTALPAFAAGWQQEAAGWRWYNDDGSVLAGTWAWLDGNGDGTAESYCFNSAGYLYTNTITPDKYTVNENGAWTVNGVVQTRPAAQTAASPAVPVVQKESGTETAPAALTAEQARDIAEYMAEILDGFYKGSRLFGTETNRSEMGYRQIAEMIYYYPKYISDPRISAGRPVFASRSTVQAIMKEVFGSATRTAMDHLENNVMTMGDNLVFNYGDREPMYSLTPDTLVWGMENGLLKITSGVMPRRAEAEDGYFVAWFSPSGAQALYGYTFERIELRRYR